MLRRAAVMRASLLAPPSLRMPPWRVLVLQKVPLQVDHLRGVSWVPGCRRPSLMQGGATVRSWMVPSIALAVRTSGLLVPLVPASPIRLQDLYASSPTAPADAPRLMLKILRQLAVLAIRQPCRASCSRGSVVPPRPPEHSLIQ